jgi:hypothetical protein
MSYCPICAAKQDEDGDCQDCISKITTEEFSNEVENLLSYMTPAAILAVPGVYEILAEEFNNEVLSNVYQAKLAKEGYR